VPAWCGCKRSGLGKLRRQRSKLLPHVMHIWWYGAGGIICGIVVVKLMGQGGCCQVAGAGGCCWRRTWHTRLEDKGRIIFWSPVGDPFIMLVLIVYGLYAGPGLAHVLLVCLLLMLPP
jgi:hypothetical protein